MALSSIAQILRLHWGWASDRHRIHPYFRPSIYFLFISWASENAMCLICFQEGGERQVAINHVFGRHLSFRARFVNRRIIVLLRNVNGRERNSPVRVDWKLLAWVERRVISRVPQWADFLVARSDSFFSGGQVGSSRFDESDEPARQLANSICLTKLDRFAGN